MAVKTTKDVLVARLQACRKAEKDRDAILDEILAQYDYLEHSHERLLEEFEDEQRRRREWQNKFDHVHQAVKITSHSDVGSAFVVVLLDGDGAIFRDELYKQGKEGGGLAAALLEDTVRAILKTTYPDEPTSSWNILTFLFLNADGLAGSLAKCDILTSREQFAAFGHAFGSANPLFNIIDVGNGKERADHKVRETLRAFLPSGQCKHIFIGPCHDNGYLPVLEPLGRRDDTKSRITLVETRPAEAGFKTLGLDMRSFEAIFRTSDLPTAHKRQRDRQPLLDQRAQDVHQNTGAVRRTSSSDDTDDSSATGWAVVVGRHAASTNGAAPAVQSTRSKHYIVLGVNDERLDPELPKVPHSANKQFEQKRQAQGANFCNNYHLYGTCTAKQCIHVHGTRLSAVEQLILKDKARGICCFEGSACRDMRCYKGHQCKFNGCTDRDCRMAVFHHINTIPYKKLYEDGRVEMILGVRA